MTYTAKLARTAEATLWVHVTGECPHELEEGELEAFGLVTKTTVADLESDLADREEEIGALKSRIAGLERMAEEREADMHVRIREGYDKTVADAWRAKVADLQAQLDAKPTGPYCAHCGGQHLGTECRMRAAEKERDDARAERDNAVRMAREVTDDLRDALAERDAIVDRICAAVTGHGYNTASIGDVRVISGDNRKAAKP